MKRTISSVIAKERAKGETTSYPDASQNAKDSAYLLSLVQSHISSTAATIQPPVAATPKSPAVALQSILKRAATSGPKWIITASSIEGRQSLNHNIYEIFYLSVNTSADTDEESRTERDSRANLVVVGMHAYILNYTYCTIEVIPFTSSYNDLKNVPNFDEIIAYGCLFLG